MRRGRGDEKGFSSHMIRKRGAECVCVRACVLARVCGVKRIRL